GFHGFSGGGVHNFGGFHGLPQPHSMPHMSTFRGLNEPSLGDFRGLNLPHGYSGPHMSDVRDNLFDGRSFNPGRANLGNFDRNNFSNFANRAAPNRTQLNHFLGLPSDAGLQALGNSHTIDGYDIHHGSAYGPAGGKIHGSYITGPQGGAVGHGAVRGPAGNVAHGSLWHGAYNDGYVGHHAGFRGGSGASAHGSSHTIDGYNIKHGSVHGPGGGKAHGTVITGPQGGQVKHGAVRGPRGNVAHGSTWHGAFNDGYVGHHAGFRHVSPSYRFNQAVIIRRGFHSWAIYSPAWYRRYPGAWFAAGWAAGYAWRAATWPAVYGWFGYPYMAPVYYDYGTNVVYENNNVYVNGQDVGTADEYYDQANQLATAGAESDAPADGKWLPLGVFAVSREDNTKTNMVMQLAVNKAGIIRGNYTDTLTGTTQKIQGSVDKKTQRAAWTIGDDSNTVIETGLYNLTKEEAPALVHFGEDRTEQWLLVRITEDDKPADGEPEDA
ncbi:MAG: protocadherin, partial [Pirellulales bacterium]|nr:protocadherin [Pirellulales bacterium]